MKLCLLASGSKGNSLYVEAGDCKLLIDSGLSARETQLRLAGIGVKGEELDGILVTHEHSDHVGGVGPLARKLKIPVFASAKTHRAAAHQVKKVEAVEFEPGTPFTLKGVHIDPFPVTHDACDPCGFRIRAGEGDIGFATDLGIVTRLVLEKLKGCRALVLEFNHDEEMLQNGPYPWHLKQRIRSRHGHLSNAEATVLLEELLHDRLDGVFLSHLSEVNNAPDLALASAQGLIGGQNSCAPSIFVGNQYVASGVLDI
ncbi:MBL fold metallo-hydrolase [Geomesophilobacter sediminis]|uniref:MBL fold metallo-hydrolase n=1 Tax=Geomesophilobacter sediminis TaxID=2798584 RepID=A0A8J7JMR1_9BACT|nr:MBL fold metallo-hydrolase [Geomesophilobacter sediminis]MBJ6726225.1 MBL fold metallo-hydrolase [Geomesophilobacter sediminis]